MSRKHVMPGHGDPADIPGPLRFLIALSLVSAVFVPVSIFSNEISIGGHLVTTRAWWANGSGYVFVASLAPFFSSGVLMMRRLPYSRALHVGAWVLLYASGLLVLTMNEVPLPTAELCWYIVPGFLQSLAIACYLFFNRRVRVYFS